jgi:hypothetical protein
MRLASGVALVAVGALVFDADLPSAAVLTFVVGLVLGDRLVEREKERGETFLDGLPSEFSGHVQRPPASVPDSRH